MQKTIFVYKKDTESLGFIIDYLHNAACGLDEKNPGDRPLKRDILKARKNIMELKKKLTKP